MLCSHDMTITICRGVDSPSGNTYHGDISAKLPPAENEEDERERNEME